MTETVRHVEERWGPYEDRRELSLATSGSIREQLQQRNQALAERTGLADAARRGLSAARWVAIALLLLALVSGIAAGRAVLGSGAAPVNLFWALTGLLGLNLLTLLIWLCSLPFGRRLHGLPAALLLRLGGRATRHLSITLPGADALPTSHDSSTDSPTKARSLLAPALLDLLRKAGLLQPLAGLLSHLWWSVTLAASLLTLAVLLATRRYGFVWETTLLDPGLFEHLTLLLGTLPSWLGFSMPDAELIGRTVGGGQLSIAEQALWSRWLLGCVVVYGLLPRLLLVLVCLLWAHHNRQNLAPDWKARGLAVQEGRLAGRADAAQILDPAPTPSSALSTAIRETTDANLTTPSARRLYLGLELGPDLPWPPPDLNTDWEDGGRYDDLRAINQLLAAWNTQPPQELTVVLDARRTPDRGIAWTLERLQQHVPHARLHLVQVPGSSDHLEQWLRLFEQHAIKLELEPLTAVCVTPPSP